MPGEFEITHQAAEYFRDLGSAPTWLTAGGQMLGWVVVTNVRTVDDSGRERNYVTLAPAP